MDTQFTLIILFPLVIALGLIFFMIWFNQGTQKALEAQEKLNSQSPYPQNSASSSVQGRSHTVQVEYTAPQRSRQEGTPAKLRLKLNIPFGSALFLSKELNGDRLLKALGLSQETEIHDDKMDWAFHIVAEDAVRTKNLLVRDDVRTILLDLSSQSGFEYLKFSDQSCELYFSNFLLFKQSYEDCLQQLTSQLECMAVAAQQIFGTEPTQATLEYAKTFALYDSSFPDVLFITGLVIGIFLFFIAPVFEVQPLHLLDAYLLTALALTGLAILVITLLRSRIRNLELPSKVFSRYASGFGFTYIAGGTALILALNSALDREPPTLVREPIIAKYISRSRKSTSYHLEVTAPVSPYIPLFPRVDILTDSTTYWNLVSRRSFVELRLHKGFFHLPWYEIVQYLP